MRVDIWADLVCPWCYLAKRRWEAALADFEHAGEVEVVWHSFQLDPTAPGHRDGVVAPTASAHLAEKFGKGPDEIHAMQQRVSDLAEAEGMTWDSHHTPYINSGDAHRLLHLARDLGGQAQASAVLESLFEAYFVHARDISDPAVLTEVADAAGLDAVRVHQTLTSSEYAEAVLADQRQAASLGANGVPFFVLAERYGISGAQPTELFARALEQAWGQAH